MRNRVLNLIYYASRGLVDLYLHTADEGYYKDKTQPFIFVFKVSATSQFCFPVYQSRIPLE